MIAAALLLGTSWSVLLAPVGENRGAPRYDRNAVVAYLRDSLARARPTLESCLSDAHAFPKLDLRISEGHWINRSVIVTSNSKLTEAERKTVERGLRACAGVRSIEPVSALNVRPAVLAEIARVKPKPSPTPTPVPAELPNYLRAIGIEALNAESPELRGRGVLIGEMDTGVDAAHPVLAGRIARFYDGEKRKETAPFDSSGHGTHVAGILVGEDPSVGRRFGVAPDAKLVATSSVGIDATMLGAMEWMLTIPDLHVVSNSWSIRSGQDPTPFYRAIESWEAAGIFGVFSAGNAGPRAGTISAPHEHPLAFAVGATTVPERADASNEELLGLSSRGPGKYLGRAIPKPELAAPGEEIYSCLPYRRYGSLSGTSMAAPMVAGTAALLLQVNPHLTPAELRVALTETARPLADSALGIRTLDSLAAVRWVRAHLALAESFRATAPMHFWSAFSPNPSPNPSPKIMEWFTLE